MYARAMALMHLTNTARAHCLCFEDVLEELEINVQALKMSHLSSRFRVGTPPFTCLTTDTCMSWTWLWSGRLKCSGTHLLGSGGSV